MIRVFDTVSKARLFEFRRGADPAQIYSIVFSKDWAFLAVTSDKGTLHVFSLRDKELFQRLFVQITEQNIEKSKATESKVKAVFGYRGKLYGLNVVPCNCANT